MFKKLSLKPMWIVVILVLSVILAFFSCQRSQFSILNLKVESDSAIEGLEPRPDVLEWIKKHFESDPKRKTAMLRLAEAEQYVLARPDDIEKSAELISIAISCHVIAFRHDEVFIDGEPSYEAVGTQTYNTWKRAKARARYHGRLSGKVLQSADVRSWEEQCEQPLPR